MTQFNPGDVVRLRSGGPEMTVYKVEGGEVNLVHMTNGAVVYADLPLAALVAVEQGKPSPVGDVPPAAAEQPPEARSPHHPYYVVHTLPWECEWPVEFKGRTDVSCTTLCEPVRGEGVQQELRSGDLYAVRMGEGGGWWGMWRVTKGGAPVNTESSTEGDADRHRRDSLLLSGLRAALAGKAPEETTCAEIEEGRREGERLRSAVLYKAADLAGDFDPFNPSWSEEERKGGVRALGLLTEKLLREAGVVTAQVAVSEPKPWRDGALGATQQSAPAPVTFWSLNDENRKHIRNANDHHTVGELTFVLDKRRIVKIAAGAQVWGARQATACVALDKSAIMESKMTFSGESATTYNFPTGDAHVVWLDAGKHSVRVDVTGTLVVDALQIKAEVVPDAEIASLRAMLRGGE